MNYDELEKLAGATESFATALAIIVGGLWAVWRFILQRERYAKIEFGLELNVLGKYADKILVEAVAVVENKGLVRHWLNGFQFDLHYLPEGSELKEGDERINYQVLFQPVIKKRYWIPPNWVKSFIDAGVIQRYTYVAHVPSNASFILLYAKFKYPDEKSEFHTAQKVFSVKEKLNGDAIGARGVVA